MPTGEDEFVELDAEGKPKPKAGAPKRAPARPTTTKKKVPTRKRVPAKGEEIADIVPDLDDLDAAASPEEIMARRAAAAKRKPAEGVAVAAADKTE